MDRSREMGERGITTGTILPVILEFTHGICPECVERLYGTGELIPAVSEKSR